MRHYTSNDLRWKCIHIFGKIEIHDLAWFSIQAMTLRTAHLREQSSAVCPVPRLVHIVEEVKVSEKVQHLFGCELWDARGCLGHPRQDHGPLVPHA